MLAQRLVQQSARRLAVRQPAASLITSRVPLAIAANSAITQKRYVETAPISEKEATNSILAKQRLNRPTSPHLGIYKPQITWYGSALNRITGSILSGGFYLFGAAYLVAPLAGWHLESASMAAAFAAWPGALKVLAKLSLALPFTYHSFNGIRHLVWDMGMGITNAQVQKSGWTVVGVSVVSALALCLM